MDENQRDAGDSAVTRRRFVQLAGAAGAHGILPVPYSPDSGPEYLTREADIRNVVRGNPLPRTLPEAIKRANSWTSP